MKYNGYFSLSMQQMQIFLKCYQYRNYSRVAKEYNFTPSMISKTIMSLEELLGLQLFERKYHSLEPTPAADELARGWKNACDDIVFSIFRAADVQNYHASYIKIGLLETTNFCADYILLKLEDYTAELENEICWERRDMHALAQALNDDELDMIITWSEEVQFLNQSRTQWKKIFSSPDAIFIPSGHPLFGKKITSLADCREHPFITLSPTGYPHYFKYLNELCRECGFEPTLSSICGSTDSARYNLHLGKGLYVAPSLICSDWESEEVQKVELAQKPATSLIIAWNKMRMTEEMNRIISLVTH